MTPHFPTALTDPYIAFDPRDAQDASIAESIERLRVQKLRSRLLLHLLRAQAATVPVSASDTCFRALAELVREELMFFLEVDGTFHLTPAGKIEANACAAISSAQRRRAL